MNARPNELEPEWKRLARSATKCVQRARHEVLAAIGDDLTHAWWPMALELGELAGTLHELTLDAELCLSRDSAAAMSRGDRAWHRCNELRSSWVDQVEHPTVWVALREAASEALNMQRAHDLLHEAGFDVVWEDEVPEHLDDADDPDDDAGEE